MTVKRTSLEAESIRSLAAAQPSPFPLSLSLFRSLLSSRALVVGLLSFLLSSGSLLPRQPRLPLPFLLSPIVAVSLSLLTFPLSSD